MGHYEQLTVLGYIKISSTSALPFMTDKNQQIKLIGVCKWCQEPDPTPISLADEGRQFIKINTPRPPVEERHSKAGSTKGVLLLQRQMSF